MGQVSCPLRRTASWLPSAERWLAVNELACATRPYRGWHVSAPIIDYFAARDVGELSTDELLQTMDEMLFANLDVTIGALSWNVVFLAAYPDIQRRVREEIRAKRAELDSMGLEFDSYITDNNTLLSRLRQRSRPSQAPCRLLRPPEPSPPPASSAASSSPPARTSSSTPMRSTSATPTGARIGRSTFRTASCQATARTRGTTTGGLVSVRASAWASLSQTSLCATSWCILLTITTLGCSSRNPWSCGAVMPRSGSTIPQMQLRCTKR